MINAVISFLNKARHFSFDQRGTSALEFALTLPILLVVVFVGYQSAEATTAYRKITLTARTVADLATQYQSMGTTDVATVLNASAQVMAPFDTSTLTIVLTEFQTTVAGVATVTWSKTLNGTALAQGAVAILPLNICLPGSSIVRSDVTYRFTPGVAYNLTGPIVMKTSIYMSPRAVQSIPYTGT